MCTPSRLSIHGTIVSTLNASNRPSTAPRSAPNQPIITPCVKNTVTTPRGVMPTVRRIAMSFRFSFTTMTSAATMLNAATATMSMRSTDVIVFSIRTARNQVAFSIDQSLRSEEHTSELQSRQYLVCRILLERQVGGLQAPGPGMWSTFFGLLGRPHQASALASDPHHLVGKAVATGLPCISPTATQARASAGG